MIIRCYSMNTPTLAPLAHSSIGPALWNQSMTNTGSSLNSMSDFDKDVLMINSFYSPGFIGSTICKSSSGCVTSTSGSGSPSGSDSSFGSGTASHACGEVAGVSGGIIVPLNTIVENTIVENTMVDNTIVDNTMVDNTIVDNTMVDNTIVENTIVDYTVVDNAVPFSSGKTSSISSGVMPFSHSCQKRNYHSSPVYLSPENEYSIIPKYTPYDDILSFIEINNNELKAIVLRFKMMDKDDTRSDIYAGIAASIRNLLEKEGYNNDYIVDVFKPIEDKGFIYRY